LLNNIQNITAYPKSSFYWGMKILEKEKRNAMFAIYAFCKKADSIADGRELKNIKKKKLKKLKKEIKKIYNKKINKKIKKNLK